MLKGEFVADLWLCPLLKNKSQYAVYS